jgi:hypothetical protein
MTEHNVWSYFGEGQIRTEESGKKKGRKEEKYKAIGGEEGSREGEKKNMETGQRTCMRDT